VPIHIRKLSEKSVPILLFLTSLILSVFLGGTYFIQDEQTRMLVSDIVFPIIGYIAAALLFAAAKQSYRQSRRLFLVWGIFGLAQFASATGELIWTILEIGFGQTPFPSIADISYLAYYPLFFFGIILLPGKNYSFREWIKKGLDIGIMVIASILVFWNFLIGPITAVASEDLYLSQVLNLAYPTGDLLLLWALLAMLYNHSNIRLNKPILLLGVSIGFLIATDCIFSYQSLSGTYISGGVLDIGWVIAYLVTGLAGLTQILSTSSQEITSDPTTARSHDLFDRIATYMPYLWVIGAFVLLLQSHSIVLPMSFSSIAIAVGAMITLVLIRQIVALVENRHLLVQLQKMMVQAQIQAGELEKANYSLKDEISIRKRAEDRLSYDALHDGLTRLPNRALFLDRLGQAIEYTRRRSDHIFSVLFIDLDHFKIVNDSLGHSIGDQLLMIIGQRLRHCLRSSDTVARLGGDEFVILLENSGADGGILHVTERIQAALSGPIQINGHDVFTTASIGVVPNLSGYIDAEEALRDADIAMYRAKALGKARVEIFNPDLRNRAVMRLLLENELRHAINHSEFELYYQPIFSLQTDSIIGFEALIRWNHPTRGLLLPAEFLLVAEETGLILPIGKWVLHQACSQISQWHKMFSGFEHLSINVNISSKQFQQTDFVDQIVTILQETGIDPSILKLEITESMVIDNASVAKEYFNRLCSLGIRLQVDDFGTGYSSLSYLQNFPIQTIKIDRSFISEIGKPGKNSDLVRTMVMMAHDLGMDAVAEGIETEQQREELKRLMCQFGQGYLMAKPMNTAGVVEILHKTTDENAIAVR